MADPRPAPRLAYCSPLPPQRSGVADYSALLLPALAAYFEIECFAPGGAAGARPLRELRPGQHDRVLYHLGNDPRAHAETYRAALRLPGVVVLHEFMLHHLVREVTLRDAGRAAYLELMRDCYGASGARAARRALDFAASAELWRFPLFEPVVDRSRAVIVHSRAALRRVLASRPGARVRRVPHPWVRAAAGPGPTTSEAARARLKLPPRGPLLGSFGFLTASKRIDVALRAFAAFRRRHPDAHYVLAGDPAPWPAARELLAGELGRGVVALGRLDAEDFDAALLAADVAINLRHPSGGETSGTLIRLLGMGKPVVVSAGGPADEIPDGCCARVGVGPDEERELTACLLALWEEPELRGAIGRAGAEHVRRFHGLERSARRYAAAVVAELAAPPVGPRPARSPIDAELTAALGAALVDVGVGDDDGEVLDAMARLLAELDLG